MTAPPNPNPRQQAIYDQLRAPDEERPVWEVGIASDLHQYIEAELAESVPASDEERSLYVGKHALETIHTCEAKWAGDAWQGWTLPMVRGTLTHKAIERLVMGNYRLIDEPMTVVTEALARLTSEDNRLAEYLQTLTLDDRDELSAKSLNDVQTFTDDWPRLSRGWTPSMEASRRYDRLLGGSVVLSAKFDIVLGKPDGMLARRVIVDSKTGNVQASHPAEARFYALVETLRQGVPPFRVGSYYLETGALVLERVNEDLLYQAASRLADGVRKMWEVSRELRVAEARPSGLCEYCPLYLGCPAGVEFIAARDAA